MRIARRLLPLTDEMHEQRFTIRRDGRRVFTPPALVLVAVESADVIFAVDSIPAIFAITQEGFIVFASNVFAILGLRSMFFALSAVLMRFRYLKLSLAVLLGVIVAILGAGIVASVLRPEKAGEGKE